MASKAPYPGLRSFRRDEIDIFFGRDGHIDEMIAKLAKAHFLCITGPSGCGKSSLARTGLMNGLESGFLPGTGSDWVLVDMRPGSDPLTNLFQAMAEAVANASHAAGGDSTSAAAAGNLAARVGEIRNLLANQIADRSHDLTAALDLMRDVEGLPVLILVDQFEELFRYAQSDPRAAVTFVDVLLKTVAAAKNIYVVITIRTDRLEQCARYPGLTAAINSSQFLTPLLDRFQVQEAIEGPISVFGGSIDRELTIWLLNSVESDSGDKLPLLQHTLKLLYQIKTAERASSAAQAAPGQPPDVTARSPINIGMSDFVQHFSVDAERDARAGQGPTVLQRLLSQRLDAICLDLPKHMQKSAERIFCALTAVETTKLDIREPLTRAQLEQITSLSREETQQVIDAFADAADAYLTVTKNPNDSSLDNVDVTHECVLRRWDRLQNEWLPRERRSADNIRYLSRSAKDYEESTHGRSWLTGTFSRIFSENTLRGKVLESYLRWFDDIRPTAAWAARYLSDFVWFDDSSGGTRLSPQAIFERITHFLRLCRVQAGRDRAIRAASFVVVGMFFILLWYNGQTVREGVQLWVDIHLSHKVLSLQAEKTLKAGDTFQECTACPPMVVVPAGQFMMGSPMSEPDRNPNEGPQHSVTIARPFAVGEFDVTFAQWDACYDLKGCNNRTGDSGWGRGSRPVIYVSWNDAQDYVRWLSRITGKTYRLLSEAEWEYAARAGTTTAYYWGERSGSGNANCKACGSRWDGARTSPVGSFAKNNFGLYDMAGNVWQWVEDCYHATPDPSGASDGGNYNSAPADGSVWQISGDCKLRVLRSGNWYAPPKYVRSASRDNFYPNAETDGVGFRVARTLGP